MRIIKYFLLMVCYLFSLSVKAECAFQGPINQKQNIWTWQSMLLGGKCARSFTFSGGSQEIKKWIFNENGKAIYTFSVSKAGKISLNDVGTLTYFILPTDPAVQIPKINTESKVVDTKDYSGLNWRFANGPTPKILECKHTDGNLNQLPYTNNKPPFDITSCSNKILFKMGSTEAKGEMVKVKSAKFIYPPNYKIEVVDQKGLSCKVAPELFYDIDQGETIVKPSSEIYNALVKFGDCNRLDLSPLNSRRSSVSPTIQSTTAPQQTKPAARSIAPPGGQFPPANTRLNPPGAHGQSAHK